MREISLDRIVKKKKNYISLTILPCCHEKDLHEFLMSETQRLLYQNLYLWLIKMTLPMICIFPFLSGG